MAGDEREPLSLLLLLLTVLPLLSRRILVAFFFFFFKFGNERECRMLRRFSLFISVALGICKSPESFFSTAVLAVVAVEFGPVAAPETPIVILLSLLTLALSS